MTAKVLLADDHKIVREGLRALLEAESDLVVVGEAGDGRQAIDLISGCRPDVVVMDISMPGLDGLESTRLIRAGEPKVKVVALSVHSEKQFVAGMLRAGASGYLLKTEAVRELIQAIRTVLTGGAYVSRQLVDPSVEGYLQQLIDEGEPPVLTRREREVLRLIAKGERNKQIADELYVTVKTIDNHRQHIMEKLDLHNAADLTRYAIKEGILIVD